MRRFLIAIDPINQEEMHPQRQSASAAVECGIMPPFLRAKTAKAQLA